MSILKYLMFAFQVYFLAETVHQEKEYNNQTQISTHQLEQNPEVKNELRNTSTLSANNSIFFYIQNFIQEIFSFIISGIHKTTDLIINPIKNLFTSPNTIAKEEPKNTIAKEEPKIQEKKDLPEDIEDSRENDTQEKQVNSVDKTDQVSAMSNLSVEQVKYAKKQNQEEKIHYNEDRTLTFKQCNIKIPNEGNAKLQIDFTNLNLQFGTDIITDHENDLHDNPEKLKKLLDFVRKIIIDHNINEFRLIMNLDTQKIFIIPYTYYPPGYNPANRRQTSNAGGDNLVTKLKNILNNQKSTFEFLYYTNTGKDNKDNIWMYGVWSRNKNNKIDPADPEFKMIVSAFDNDTRNSSSNNPTFKKDIIEMWFDWNDAQKNNYCYGILRALRSMGLKKYPGLYLKWNRGIEHKNQSQIMNHFHIILPTLTDEFKSLYNHRRKLISSVFLPQKGLSSLDTNLFFSANEKEFLTST